MSTFSVMGINTPMPNTSAAGASLGRALMDGLGGPTPLQQLQIDKFKLGMEEMKRRQALLDEQTALTHSKAQGEDLANENLIKMRELATQGAQTAGAANAGRIPVPVKPVYGPEQFPGTYDNQKRQYDLDVAAAKANAGYTYGVGDGTPNQRAAALNDLTGGNLIQYGDANQARRGATMMGHIPGLNSYLGTGDDAPMVNAQADALKARLSPATPHFFENGNYVAVPDPSSPSGYRRELLGGVDPSSSLYGNDEKARSAEVLSKLKQKMANGDQLSPAEQDAYAFHHSVVFPNSREIEVGPNKYLTNPNPDSASRFPQVGDVFNGGRGPNLPAPVPVEPFTLPNNARSPIMGAAPVIVGQEGGDGARGSGPNPNSIMFNSGAGGARGGNGAGQRDPLIPPGALDIGPSNKNNTEFAGKAKMFSGAMLLAEQTLSQTQVPTEAPGVLEQLTNAPNRNAYITVLSKAMSDPATQEYFQAAEAYVTNYLRAVSGATIGDPEYQRTFNWLIGTGNDTPRTMAQKKAQRDQLTLSLAGTGYGDRSPEMSDMADKLSRINRGEQVFDIYGNMGGGAGGGAPRAPAQQGGGASASQPQSIPLDDIKDLRKNPALRADFDQVYGQGAAAAILGE